MLLVLGQKGKKSADTLVEALDRHHKESVWKSSKVKVRYKSSDIRTEGQTCREKEKGHRS